MKLRNIMSSSEDDLVFNPLNRKQLKTYNKSNKIPKRRNNTIFNSKKLERKINIVTS